MTGILIYYIGIIISTPFRCCTAGKKGNSSAGSGKIPNASVASVNCSNLRSYRRNKVEENLSSATQGGNFDRIRSSSADSGNISNTSVAPGNCNKLRLYRRNKVGETSVNLATQEGNVDGTRNSSTDSRGISSTSASPVNCNKLRSYRRNKVEETIVHLPVQEGNFDRVEHNSADPRERPSASVSAPVAPVSYNRLRSYRRNRVGETPLHLAAKKGNFNKISQLLHEGIDVNVTDHAGWTALHEACNYGNFEIAKLLIEFGANVNASAENQDTPLHDASLNGHHKIVALLLKCGADPNAKNAEHKMPIDVARAEEVTNLLNNSVSPEDFDLVPEVLEAPSEGEEEKKKDKKKKKKKKLRTEEQGNWQSKTSPCHQQSYLCTLTMRKNSPQNQTHKGADKPTSPRLTLRFQSIRSRDDKNSNNSKVNDLTSTQPKYPSYCVTMETKGDVYDFQKDDSVASSQSSDPVPESEICAPKSSTASNKEVDSSAKDSKVSVESVGNLDPSQIENMDTSDVSSVKVNGGRVLSSESNLNKEREYSSDTEKEESRRKRRKSSDNGQGRHNSVGHASATKNHKSPSNRTVHQDGHNEQRSSPKGKKRGSLSSSETESNPSDTEMQDIAIQDSATSANHNGNLSATGLHSPKVPPLKIVIPSGSNSLELETRERSKVSSSKTALPYVVNTAEAVETSSNEVSASSTFSTDGNKDGSRCTDSTPSKSREDNHPPEERFQRVTRSSQRMQAAMSNTAAIPSSSDMTHANSVSSNCPKAELSGESSNEDQTMNAPTDVHPRKRKLRTRDNQTEGGSSNLNQIPPTVSSSSSSNEDSQQHQHQQMNQPQQHHQLLNSYQMYLNIRKQVGKRRKSMYVVHPKAPQGFKDYLLNRCSYVLEGNAASRLSVPMIPPPQKLEGSFKELFIQQEQERYRLRLQHLIEREKLVLSAEQEILRVHGRAARAMVNQTIPLSACSVLKDEEIYNVLDVDQDDKDKNVRSRYNGRLFLSWLQDVDDKWEKIKEAMLLRHHNEAESLHAVQKLDWEWKMKELAICDLKSTPVIDDISVPMVHVSDDFDLLPA